MLLRPKTRQTAGGPSPPARWRSQRGFSILELMVVVAIISFMMALAVPTFQRIQRRTRTAAIVNDFRVFTQGFLTYSVEQGGFPPEAAAGVIPTGMDSALRPTPWARPTPMGGKYNWENNQMQLFGFRPKAAVAISSAPGAPLSLNAETINMLYALDLFIDNEVNGWNTGQFRLSGAILPLYVIEP